MNTKIHCDYLSIIPLRKLMGKLIVLSHHRHQLPVVVIHIEQHNTVRAE